MKAHMRPSSAPAGDEASSPRPRPRSPGPCPETASRPWPRSRAASRSEEHTSELQSLMRISYAVFCLKKKRTDNDTDVEEEVKIERKRTHEAINGIHQSEQNKN